MSRTAFCATARSARSPSTNSTSPACGQVVHHPHRLAPLHQLLDQVGADESCTAGDKVGRHLQRIAISSQDFSVLSLHSSVLFS